MTHRVIAHVASVNGQQSGGIYIVGLDVWVTDGTTGTQINGNAFQVPFTGSTTKMNRVLKEQLVSYLSSSWSITIDPEDIYFPFT